MDCALGDGQNRAGYSIQQLHCVLVPNFFDLEKKTRELAVYENEIWGLFGNKLGDSLVKLFDFFLIAKDLLYTAFGI